MKLKSTLLAVAIASNVGCAGAPVGWGGTFEPSMATQETIVYEYDSLLTSVAKVSTDASRHCAQYGKSARLSQSSNTFLVGVLVFDCL